LTLIGGETTMGARSHTPRSGVIGLIAVLLAAVLIVAAAVAAAVLLRRRRHRAAG
jgi:hypothetical protein